MLLKWIFGNQKYYKKRCLRESINSIRDFFRKEEKKKKASWHSIFRSTCRARCTEQEDILGIVWGWWLKYKYVAGELKTRLAQNGELYAIKKNAKLYANNKTISIVWCSRRAKARLAQNGELEKVLRTRRKQWLN